MASELTDVSIGRLPAARDPAEAVALVASSRRALLLRVHRRRLRFEDLEDCYSQATLELLARARRAPFQSSAHIANALEQKFLSRIDDRRRAISGRSAMEAALATAVPVDEPESGAGEIEDRGAEVLRKVASRLEVRRLREVAADLTPDQRLVLACQVGLDMDCAEFCERYRWSPEKFRKVAQRARARLRVLVDGYQAGDRCRELADELLAFASGVSEQRASERVSRHLENCTSCARYVRDLERASRQVAALLPPPLVATAGLGAKAALGAKAGVSAGAGGGAFGAGGSLVGAGLVKLGVAAACVAGAAGGLALCTHAGLLGGHGGAARSRHVARRNEGLAVAPAAIAPRRTAALPRDTGGRTHVHYEAAQLLTGPAAAAQARQEFGTGSRRSASTASQPSQAAWILQRPAAATASTRHGASRSVREFGFER